MSEALDPSPAPLPPLPPIPFSGFSSPAPRSSESEATESKSWADAPGLWRFQRRTKARAQDELPPRCPPLEPPNPADYPEDLARKAARVQGLLEDYLPRESGEPQLDLVPSPELLHYRHRVKFQLRHYDAGRVGFVVFDPESEDWLPVEQFPLASRRINRLMGDLREAFFSSHRARNKAFHVELLSGTSGGALACVMYHRRLDRSADGRVARWLAGRLGAAVVLRARGQRLVGAGRPDYLVQNSQLAGHSFPQHLLEDGFFQANLRLNRAIQRWVQHETSCISGSSWPPQRDLLELFCGNGNLTLPAAGSFRRVLATELDRRAVAAASACAQRAGIDNVQFKGIKAEEVSLTGGAGNDFDFAALLVDPPRKGLDANSLAIASCFEHVVYVSCNPQALARDLRSLSGHRVVAACLFDQFPWTDHAEVAVRLRKEC